MTKETNTYSASGEVGSLRQRRTRWERIWIDLKKAPPTAIFGIVVILAYAFVSIFASSQPLGSVFGALLAVLGLVFGIHVVPFHSRCILVRSTTWLLLLAIWSPFA